MPKRRMISEEVYNLDEFLDLSDKASRLFDYLLLETDQDGIVKGIRKIMNSIQAEKTHLKELVDKGFILKEPKKEVYAITDFHILNSMDKNNEKNPRKHILTKEISFKKLLYVTEDSRLTLNKNEGFMPYILYDTGGSMSKVLEAYRKQKEDLEAQEDLKKESEDKGLSELEMKIQKENPNYFKNE